MNIALLFGSFNPIHNGHLAMAKAALQSNKIDEVWFVVSPHNPLKDLSILAPAEDRAHMVSLAIHGEEKIKLCTIEFNMPTPSYTVNTIHQLKSEYPSFHFHILCGTDVVNSLPAWHKFEELIQEVKFMVCSRETHEEISSNDFMKKFSSQFEFIPFNTIEISSTTIREQIKNRKDSSQVTKQVLEYIIAQRLYGF